MVYHHDLFTPSTPTFSSFVQSSVRAKNIKSYFINKKRGFYSNATSIKVQTTMLVTFFFPIQKRWQGFYSAYKYYYAYLW